MALSGGFTTTSYNGRYYKLFWTAEQSIAQNQSVINWTLSAEGGNGWIAERAVNLIIDGKPVFSKTDRVERYAEVIATGSTTLKHDTSGQKSFSMSLEAAVYYSYINCTGSSSVTLNPIPRAAKLLSVTKFNDEQNPTITYSNPAGANVEALQACISLTGARADVAYKDISKTGSSFTFSLTDAERKVLRQGTTANSREITIYLKTVIGGVSYTDALKTTLTIVNAKPAIAATIVDTNETTINLTGDSSKFIKYFSNAKITATATAKKEATIKELKIKNTAYTVANVTTSIENIADNKITISAKDSRGNSTTLTKNLTVIEYVKPTCNLTATATLASDNTTTINITVSGTCFNGSFGAVNNSIVVFYKYKKDSDSYSAVTTTLTPVFGTNTYKATGTITGLSYQETYNIQAKVMDILSNVYSQEATVRALPVFDWGKNDFNINVPLNMDGAAALRKSTNNIVISATGGNVFIRPNGSTNTDGQFTFGATGNAEIRGDLRVLGGATIGGKKLATQTLLHTDSGRFMNAEQTIVLEGSKRLPEQLTGYIFCWYYYNNGLLSQHIQYTFAPKSMLEYNSLIVMPVVLATGETGAKALNITDDGTSTTISGVDTNSGYSPNNKLVLRRIIGY